MLGTWWNTLSGAEQIFWSISIVFSILFIIQFVLSLVGLDFDSDTDTDIDTDTTVESDYSLDPEFSLLSIRSIIAFFTFFGWTGVLMLNAGTSTTTALIISTIVGFTAMFLVGYMLFSFAKLSQEGNVDLSEALFNTGEVYLTIPQKTGGKGKVHLSIQGSKKSKPERKSGFWRFLTIQPLW
jgi:hypothetical protein